MSDEKNISEIITFFGDTELKANPNFKKYKESRPYDPYGVIIERTYRARLSDITSDLDEIKQAFKESGRQFHNDIFVLVELSFLKDSSGHVNICISAFPSVAFRDSDSPQYIEYCGGEKESARVMTEDRNMAEEYLEDMLAPENIVKRVVATIRKHS